MTRKQAHDLLDRLEETAKRTRKYPEVSLSAVLYIIAASMLSEPTEMNAAMWRLLLNEKITEWEEEAFNNLSKT